jgi:uncharacterized protein YbjT (DUF2867 family)
MKIAVAGGTGAVGHHVVDVARERGHAPVVLSRSNGVDLVAGTGIAQALAGVDVVIDVASIETLSDREPVEFFGAVTANLLAAERAEGVAHHVALSIVGTDRAPYGYYAGKALQERLVAEGDVPWTLLRATQFHEFATQLHARGVRLGPLVIVPRMTSRPVAAREVAERLIELAVDAPAARVADLAGPGVREMSSLVKEWARHTGLRGPILAVPLPGAFGKAMRDGSLLPKAGASVTFGTQTFEQWLTAH